ncbi:thiopurine S-methyltransferase [Winogradskyella wandonensis]|uniref:Thiopurine S-methyltransferase n=1 Tax=Winogradskyella wandonensis TaxID=1442586 RepID=A0A4R1KNG5_9FLAO|nr:SAM-dependent methyltransferase [Winogradskyella wandonensis]TCK66614.1 thiopurine S-methyltransferase [Winogradskyella wandonensis]
MKKNRFTELYWEERYLKETTGWNIGEISRPLKEYINQLEDKSLSILIPGAGNGYETEYLWLSGFKNVHMLDIARQPLLNFSTRVPNFPKQQLINDDFFNLEMKFDLILEQTFFCALEPSLRKDYAQKMSSLLRDKGKLSGILFNFELTEQGPPFGGDIKSYKILFEKYFKIKTLEPAYNSIEQRKDKELFFIFEKK